MLVAGLDIGSRTVKAVIMSDGTILAYRMGPAKPKIVETTLTIMNEALEEVGFLSESLQYVVATGYGRVVVPFANEIVSEISCHIRGALWYFPSVRTILDIGGQDSKAIRCNDKGQIVNFVMNDKCAGGTGRFLETIADAWEIPVQNIGELALQSNKPTQFSTTCVIFARSEAITLLSKGVPKEDILAGIVESIADRNCDMLLGIGVERDFIITGGVAKNVGIVEKIRERIGLTPLSAPEPSIVGAVGAAVIANKRLSVKQKAL